ncbi:MAG: hypothetical protein JSW53_03705, partial [Candidatus Bathyarchaeota archaeon]
ATTKADAETISEKPASSSNRIMDLKDTDVGCAKQAFHANRRFPRRKTYEHAQFCDETHHCERASLSGLGSFVSEKKIWDKEKVRRFITWFVLEGLEEGWLIDEMGG